MPGVNTSKPAATQPAANNQNNAKNTAQAGVAKDINAAGVDMGGVGGDMDTLMGDTEAAMQAMFKAQTAIQMLGMGMQIKTAALNILGQSVGAGTAMAVQTVTDLVKNSKDAVKAQGEAFQKAN